MPRPHHTLPPGKAGAPGNGPDLATAPAKRKKRGGGPPKRSTGQRQIDLRDIARLWREGQTHYEIRDWLNAHRPYKLTRQQVTYDVAEMRETWQKEYATKVDERISRQLATIDAQEQAAWKAWNASIGEVTEVETEKIEGPKTEGKDAEQARARAKVKKLISHGDPRYMAVISQCIEARNRLLGLTKAKVELSGPDGGAIPVEGVSGDFDMTTIDKFLESQYAKRSAKHESQPNPTGQG